MLDTLFIGFAGLVVLILLFATIGLPAVLYIGIFYGGLKISADWFEYLSEGIGHFIFEYGW